MKAIKRMKYNKRKVVGDILFTLGIILISVILQYVLSLLELKDENIFLLFTLAILFIIIKTKNIIYGIISSFLFVLAFNYFNAEPLFTLVIDDANYYISFLIFMAVSFIVGYLVLDIQRKNNKAIENGRKVEAMYSLSAELIDNHDKPFIFNFVLEFFKNYMAYDFSIIDTKGKLYGSEINDSMANDMLVYSLKRNMPVGKGTFDFEGSNYLVFPIRSTEYEYGALYVNLTAYEITSDEIEFIKKNILHLVVALDRELAIKKQEEASVAIEKEKFKNSILRSLSHDLKTPLTSIKSGSDLILESYDELDDASKKEIVKDIYLEACDLHTFIVNLLNMTKLDQGKLLANRKYEPVDDILAGVYSKASRELNGRRLIIEQSESLEFVYTDQVLLDMVLVNLIDNAIKHTKSETTIRVSYSNDGNGISFMVSDNGGGIDEASLDKIFEDFYSLAKNEDRRRSNGLGLSICRAIVEAHGGRIEAFNNTYGGASFRFNIPNEEVSSHGK